jgi:hypothetical protein
MFYDFNHPFLLQGADLHFADSKFFGGFSERGKEGLLKRQCIRDFIIYII